MGYDIHNKLLNQFRFDLWRDAVVGFLPLTLVHKRGDILLLQTMGQCGRVRRRQTNHLGNLMVGQKAAVKHRKQNGSYLQDILPTNLQLPTPYSEVDNDTFVRDRKSTRSRLGRRLRQKGRHAAPSIFQSAQAVAGHGLDNRLGSFRGNVQSLADGPAVDAQQVERKTQKALNHVHTQQLLSAPHAILMEIARKSKILAIYQLEFACHS